MCLNIKDPPLQKTHKASCTNLSYLPKQQAHNDPPIRCPLIGSIVQPGTLVTPHTVGSFLKHTR
jgi:hypothetical protein